MKPYSTLKYSLFVVVLLCLGFSARATNEIFDFIYQPNQVYVGSVQSLEATAQNCGTYNDAGFEHLVSLYLDPDYDVIVSDNVEITFNLTVRLYQEGSGTAHTTLSGIQLSIDPDNDQPFQTSISEEAYHIETGDYKVEVEIISVMQGGVTLSNIPDNVLLKIQTRAERYYDFNSLNAPSGLQHILIEDADNQLVNSSPDPDVAYANVEEIEIQWDCMPGAEEYELEWAYINDYKKSDGSFYNAVDITLDDRDFKLNNTRVTISSTSYRVPLLYDHGFIVYRVRGVGRNNAPNLVVKGYWTSNGATNVGGYGYQRMAEHQATKKWQSSMVFAEEGKKKEVLNYMDGTQRSRQNVTRNSTENEAVVAETFYDHQGRPKIQVLPVPANDSQLDFYEGFNKDDQGNAYYKTRFDEDKAQCAEAAPAMSEISGAAQYYSSSNPDLSGKNAFLPDASGYAFTETQYEADNTNRIRRQSGVGVDHKLGSGHDTRYFYNVPDQKELDRLFGTEVGYARHYRKITVIDPNGQASITYQDLAGNVIATALTGDGPSSVVALESEETPLQNTITTGQTVDMLNKRYSVDTDTELDNNMINAAGNGLDLNYNFTLPKDDDLYGYYSVQIPAFNDNCVSYEPIMDLDISFWSTDCNTYLSGTAPGTRIGNYTTELAGASSGTFQIGTSDEHMDISAGGYRVEKSLRVNEEYMEDYATHYAENASCLLTLDDFIQEAWTDVDTTDCETDTVQTTDGTWVYDCQSCLDDLGELVNFPGTAAEYNKLKAECEEPCATYISGCELIRNSLLVDLNPGGQYAGYEVDEAGNYYSDDPLSIFNTGINEPNRLPVYLTGGSIDLNTLFGTTDLEEIIGNWSDAYTNAVLQYHPEWEYYDQICTDLTDVPSGFSVSSEEFDWSLGQISTFDEADAEGYINFGNLNDYSYLLDADPYFGAFSSEKTLMDNRLANVEGSGLNVFEFAARQVSCGNWFGTGGGSCSGSFGTGPTDKQWQIAMGLYLSIKQEVIGLRYNLEALNVSNIVSNGYTGYFNGGIGYKEFNFPQYIQSAFPSSSWSSSAGQNVILNIWEKQLISGPDRPLYTSKQKRVVFPDPLLPKDEAGAMAADEDARNAEVYKRTGLCPLAFELKGFIDYMLANRILDATSPDNNLLYVNGYSPTLYKAVEQVSDLSGPYVEREYESNISGGGTTLILDLIDLNGSNDITSFLALSVESGSSFSWADYENGVIQIPNVRQLVPNGQNSSGNYGFALQIEVISATGEKYVEVLNGTVKNIDIANCSSVASYNPVVKNDIGNGLEEFLNLLLANDDLTGTDVKLQDQTLPYYPYFNKMFRQFLDPQGFYNNFVWSQVSGTTDEFEVHSSITAYTGLTLEGPKSIRFKFCSFPSGFSSYADVDYFESLKPDFNGSGCSGNSNVGIGLVKLVNNSGTAIASRGTQYFRMSLYSGQGSTATLDEDISTTNDENSTPEEEECVVFEDNRDLLIRLIDEIWTHPTNPIIGQYEVNTDFSFTAEELQTIRGFAGTFTNKKYGSSSLDPYTFLGALATEVPDNEEDYVIAFWGHHGISDVNSLTLNDDDFIAGEVPGLYVQIGERSYGDYSCHIEMEFMRQGEGLRFTDIASLEKLVPKPGTGAGGVTHEFLAMVKMNDDSYEWIEGYSCFDLSTCLTCTEVSPVVPVNCWSAYAYYGAYMESNVLGAVVQDEEDFCTSRLHQFSDAYLDYISTMGIASASSPYYISIEEFAHLNSGYYLGYYLDYVAAVLNVTVANIATNLPSVPSQLFVMLNEFSEAQLGNSCLGDYATYLASSPANPVSILDYCFGYEPEYPCPLLDFQPTDVFIPSVNPCVEYYTNVVQTNAAIAYTTYINDIKADFKERYIDHCISSAVETFTRTGSGTADYQYTLYYYDQAGNLVKTVPPAGVQPLDVTNTTEMDAVTTNRINGNNYPVNHNANLETTYKYNSLNQLTFQKTPDGGETYFWYDRLGRLVASRNSKQINDNECSYTKYDALGRIIESGVVKGQPGYALHSINETRLNDPSFPLSLCSHPAPDFYEVTHTFYDELNADVDDFATYYSSLEVENLRSRVSSTVYYEVLPYANNAHDYSHYQYATHYSYDEHGNVKTLVQDKPHFVLDQQRYKRLDYYYDLVSGNVNEVHYQKGAFDALFHRYSYDADNRITTVETSRNGLLWNKDAGYDYYKHGPLARIELGNKVQGMDYAYTLQGWLKSVNASTLHPEREMGKDGYYDGRSDFAPDAMAFSLHYHENDYQPIGDFGVSNLNHAVVDIGQMSINDLYNGNIAAIVTSLLDNNENRLEALGMRYTYDQLNRLHSAVAYRSLSTGDMVWANNNFDGVSASSDYLVNVSYDSNGNISTLVRNGYAASGNLPMDNFTYHYDTNKKNRLLYVSDDSTYEPYYPDDMDGQSSGNYRYDEIGNLEADSEEEIEEIVWLANGKIKEINRAVSSIRPSLAFEYDAMGNRVTKIEKPAGSSEEGWKYTHYVRDASGNTMAVYREAMAGCIGCEEPATHEIRLSLLEHSLYGSDRLGIWESTRYQKREGVYYQGEPPTWSDVRFVDYNDEAPYYSTKLGEKRYELKNHLGNVLSVVSDSRYLEQDIRPEYYEKFDDPVGLEVVRNATYEWDNGRLKVTNTHNVGGVYMEFNGLTPNETYYFGADVDWDNLLTKFTIEYWDEVNGAWLTDQNINPSTSSQQRFYMAPFTAEAERIRIFAHTNDLNLAWGVAYTTPEVFYLDNVTIARAWTADASVSSMDRVNWGFLRFYCTKDEEGVSRLWDVLPGEKYNFHFTFGKIATNSYSVTAPGVQVRVSEWDNGSWSLVNSMHVAPDANDYIEYTLPFSSVSDQVKIEFWHDDLTLSAGATVNDNRIIFLKEHLELIDHYQTADVISAQHYYPFGMTMPGRTFNGGDYRYGFNGMEGDSEVKGTGNSYTTEFRQYDPRLGRWLSRDPIVHHGASPYNAFDNSPIVIIDPSGADGGEVNEKNQINATVYFENDGSLSAEEFNSYVDYAKQNIADIYSAEGLDPSTINYKILGASDNRDNILSNQYNNILTVTKGSGTSHINSDQQTGLLFASELGNTAAHEFGHLFGLADRYVETAAAIPNSSLKDKRFTTPMIGIPDGGYDAGTNLYSSGGADLTPMQLDIMRDISVNETSYNHGVIAVVNSRQLKSRISMTVDNLNNNITLTMTNDKGKTEDLKFIGRNSEGGFYGTGTYLLREGTLKTRQNNLSILETTFGH